ARGGPNIKVERSPPVAGLAEAEGKGRAGATGAPGTGPAGGCAAARAAGWLNTTVERPGGAGFFGATGAVLRFPVWNIIVRPAASSAAGAAGFAMGACAGGAGGAGRAAAAGAGAPEAGAANIIVVCAAEGLAGGGGAAFAGRAASAAAAGRTTLNVFWHLPQRMVSPCGPIRASSTRYRAWHFSLLALWSYKPRGASENWAGPVGHSFAGTLLEATGVGGYALALFLFAAACALLLGRPRLSFARAASWLLFSFCAMGLLDLLVHGRLQGHPAGGAVGSTLAGTARAALSVPGAAVLLSAVAGAALVVATDLWAPPAARGAAKLGVFGGALAVRGAAAAFNKARTVSFGDQDLFAGEDGRIVEPSRPGASKAALALAAAAAQEAPRDPSEAVVAAEGKGRRRKEPSQPEGARESVGPREP